MQPLDNQTYNENTPSNLPQDVVNEMKATTPWMKLMAVLGFIYCLFLLVGGVYVFVSAPDLGMAMGALITNLIIVLLILIPNIFLMQHANRLSAYSVTRSHPDLLTAFRKKKAFWRFLGIVTIIFVLISIVIAVIGLAGNMFGGGDMEGF